MLESNKLAANILCNQNGLSRFLGFWIGTEKNQIILQNGLGIGKNQIPQNGCGTVNKKNQISLAKWFQNRILQNSFGTKLKEI